MPLPDGYRPCGSCRTRIAPSRQVAPRPGRAGRRRRPARGIRDGEAVALRCVRLVNAGRTTAEAEGDATAARRGGGRGWRGTRRGDGGSVWSQDEEGAADREHADGGGRGDTGGSGHGREPPRRAPGTPLSSQVDLVGDGVQHAVGDLLGAIGQPGCGDPFEIAIRSHARRSVDVRRPGIGVERRPERFGGVIDPGLDGPERDIELGGDLGQVRPT